MLELFEQTRLIRGKLDSEARALAKTILREPVFHSDTEVSGGSEIEEASHNSSHADDSQRGSRSDLSVERHLLRHFDNGGRRI